MDTEDYMAKLKGAGQPNGVSNAESAIISAKPRSFFKAPLWANIDELDADVGFIGIPFDQGTFGRPGARFGPDAIRDAPGAYSYADPYGNKSLGALYSLDRRDFGMQEITQALR